MTKKERARLAFLAAQSVPALGTVEEEEEAALETVQTTIREVATPVVARANVMAAYTARREALEALRLALNASHYADEHGRESSAQRSVLRCEAVAAWENAVAAHARVTRALEDLEGAVEERPRGVTIH